MIRIGTVKGALALTILLAVTGAVSASAATVSVLPSPVPDKTVGDAFSVDIMISDLTEPVGGFSFFLYFDDSVISSTGYALDPGSLMDPAIDQSVFTAGVSPLEMYFFSDLGADLTGQGTGFTLATVDFSAIANGLSVIGIRDLVVSNGEGTAEIPADIENSLVCVGGRCTVPEPGLIALFGTAASVMFARRRRQHRTDA